MPTINTQLLQREWRFKCKPEEQDGFFEASAYLDEKMHTLNHEGRATGYDQIALLAALTLSYELIQERKKNRRQEKLMKEIKTDMLRLRKQLASELVD